MVTFNKDSFTVTVETGTDPVEYWLATHQELVDALKCEDEQMIAKRFHYLELLSQLMPDWETAKKMTVDLEKIGKQ